MSTTSIATELGLLSHVRFTPVSDRTADIAGGPVGAQERTSSRPVGMSENVRAIRHQMIPFHKMQFSCTGRNPL
jgi:hypothetical protein